MSLCVQILGNFDYVPIGKYEMEYSIDLRICCLPQTPRSQSQQPRGRQPWLEREAS